MKTITLPATMKITAGEKPVRFAPYKENFISTVAANTSLSLRVDTVGQYLYYAKQGFEEGTGADMEIPAPAKVKIENKSGKVQGFVPYRENFTQEVEVNGGYEFTVKTAGQALYYIAQDTNGLGLDGGLDVTVTATTVANGEEASN